MFLIKIIKFLYQNLEDLVKEKLKVNKLVILIQVFNQIFHQKEEFTKGQLKVLLLKLILQKC